MAKKKSRPITVENVKGSLGFLILTFLLASVLFYSGMCFNLLDGLDTTFTTTFGMIIMALIMITSLSTGLTCFIYSLNRIFGEELWDC